VEMLLLAHKIIYEKEKELKDEVAGLIAMQDRPLAGNEGESVPLVQPCTQAPFGTNSGNQMDGSSTAGFSFLSLLCQKNFKFTLLFRLLVRIVCGKDNLTEAAASVVTLGTPSKPSPVNTNPPSKPLKAELKTTGESFL